MRGYIQVYTGDGKGKTTAALGLALRAAGAGLRVYICQFMKKGDYSEIKALETYHDLITVEQFGTGKFIEGKPSPEDIKAAQEAVRRIKEIFSNGEHDVLIMDEANVALHLGLLSMDDIKDIIQSKPEGMEIVLTGRNAPQELIEDADLVTEMKLIKHYFKDGVHARTGIEK
ncbi:cob(I)yrinic acid a,c-diamide adenosyltransferase [Thermodesulfobacteriota bacterium]